MTFDSSFFLSLPSFFSLSAWVCQTMSYMQGYTLSGQGLRAYKVNGPWLKQVWSCSRMGKPELPCAAKATAAVMWIYVQRMCGLNLQTINKGGKTHCVLIRSNITLHTWPKAELEQWRCLKGGYTCWITLPETSSPSLSFMSYSIYVTVISLCVMN